MSANFLLPLICIRSLQGIVGEVWRGKGRGRGGGERKKRRRHESVYQKKKKKKKRNDIRQCGCCGSVPFNVSCKYLACCTCRFRWSSLHHINLTPEPHYCPLCCQDRYLFLPLYLSPSICLCLSVCLSVCVSLTYKWCPVISFIHQ